jgi:hypothetical protein
MLSGWPFLTVDASLKLTDPNASNGNRRPRLALGASTTHSADERDDAYGIVTW